MVCQSSGIGDLEWRQSSNGVSTGSVGQGISGIRHGGRVEMVEALRYYMACMLRKIRELIEVTYQRDKYCCRYVTFSPCEVLMKSQMKQLLRQGYISMDFPCIERDGGNTYAKSQMSVF